MIYRLAKHDFIHELPTVQQPKCRWYASKGYLIYNSKDGKLYRCTGFRRGGYHMRLLETSSAPSVKLPMDGTCYMIAHFNSLLKAIEEKALEEITKQFT